MLSTQVPSKAQPTSRRPLGVSWICWKSFMPPCLKETYSSSPPPGSRPRLVLRPYLPHPVAYSVCPSAVVVSAETLPSKSRRRTRRALRGSHTQIVPSRDADTSHLLVVHNAVTGSSCSGCSDTCRAALCAAATSHARISRLPVPV